MVQRSPNQTIISFQDTNCVIQLPEKLDSTSPLLLFFHGRGGRAQDSNFHSKEFAGFKKKAYEKGFLVAIPDYGSDCWMNQKAEMMVLEFVAHLRRQYPLDENHLFVMGVSMGGGASLTFSLRHPDKVTAVCDIMGVTNFVRFYHEGNYRNSIGPAFGGSPEEKPEVYRQRSAICNIDVLKKLPLLILHGADDTLVPLWNSETLYEKLRQAGGKVEFLRIPHVGHDNGIIAGLEDKVLDFFGSMLG